MSAFPLLLSPLELGGITIRNRIVSAGHDTTLPTDGRVNDALVAYHRARAEGGAGLIVAQVAGVHDTARYTSHLLMATDDGCIPGYRALAEAVHVAGAHVVGQLFHPGRELMESQDGTAPVAYSASDVPSERFHVTPRPLAIAEIDEIIEGYAAAARRLVRAGLDGVEVVASHGYLPAQFLNPRTNRRDDRYGGSEQGRLRFLREVLGAVRDAVPGTLVGLRISGDERSHDGLQPTEARMACRALARDGLVGYVSVCAGSSATIAGSTHIVPPMAVAPGTTAELAAAIRHVVDAPVIVGGRINEPQLAERLLRDGAADACAMTRALICDPDLPRKAAEGRAEDVRACIACNQACIGHFHAGYPISCIQHPETGRELRFGARTAAARRRRVLVVGGGPGGLKAAAVAAERGHDVTLLEAAPHVGGQALLAQELPGRAEFGGIVTNLAGEARRAGVQVSCGVRVDRAVVEEHMPDVVVIATGARPRRPALELLGAPAVLDAWEVLRGAELPSGRIVVADWRCDWVGPGLAELAASRGRRVVLAVNGYMPGQRLQQYVRDTWLATLHRLRVEVIPTVRLFGIDDDSVYLQHTPSGEAVVVEDVQGLVLAQGHVRDDALAEELVGWSGEVVLVGDCRTPRTAEEAVLEGLEVGCAI